MLLQLLNKQSFTENLSISRNLQFFVTANQKSLKKVESLNESSGQRDMLKTRPSGSGN